MIEKIWKEFNKQLLAFIISKVKDKSIAEDILQDVFIKVHQNIASLESKDKLSAWLYTISRNSIFDYYRKNAIKFSDINLDELEHSSKVKNEHLNSCIEILIKSMPQDYGEVLNASELQGQKQKQIAQSQGLSLPAVKSRVKRGREQLKDKLKACCDFEFKEDGGVESYCKKQCGCGG